MRSLKILVYVDTGAPGEWAISIAKELVEALTASLILLTTEENMEEDPQVLDRAATALEGAAGGEITRSVRPGPARDAIVAESLECSPAISIFPPAGRRGLARVFKGSRVKTVVHNSPSTVVVARRPSADRIRRVLVTVSGGPMSETTLLSAHEVVRALEAEVTLLHVHSSVNLPSPHDDAVPTASDVDIPDVTPMLDRLNWEPGKEPKVVVRRGMVVREILEECAGGYDLLILGQHLAVREAGGPLSANIAEILALECPLPVLIVRPRRWAAGAHKRPE